MTERKVSFVEDLLSRAGSPENALNALYANIVAQPVDTRLNLQVVLNVLGREEDSFLYSNQLMVIAPNDLRVRFNHGWHLLKRGQLEQGLMYLESGRPLETYGHKPLPTRQPLWRPENGFGHRIHLVLEGGLGDEMIHFRFGRDLTEKYGCRVTVICNASLSDIFARQPWVAAVSQREASLDLPHDSWLPGMSAALALGLQFKDLRGEAYILPCEAHKAQWCERLTALTAQERTRRFRVGIRWAGNPQFEHQQFRLFPPELLLSLVDIPEIQFFSFQRDDSLVNLPPEIVDLAPHLRTWDDTAAALANMDLVISSCTSVAHMSAAIGQPTWVVVPVLPYFVWALPGETSPWYNSVRLFRQSRFGDWSDVARELREALTYRFVNASLPI